MENMQNNFENLEVLAPAGSVECFDAAIANGADAVYLGLSNFNARMKAQNFTTENIRKYISYAHSFGVKVYITINTLLQNENFADLIEMVKILVHEKADAFIVQDLGVAFVLKSAFPNIVLHASTQMGIHNLQGAKVAENLGFSRIVLSRETTLEDIKQIKQNTKLEIEYFVQGALCVAFSGNCYLSGFENNQSGNEGKCLQLCRLPYTNNLTGETNYALSTRDLCLLKNLSKLVDAGVTSFKIEGRMRHAGYVATATNVYKNAINSIKKRNFYNLNFENDILNLQKTYSRGEFNENAYLFKQKDNAVIFKTHQNHIGIKIGTVLKVEPFKNDLFKVTIQSNKPLVFGDGLKIINPKTNKQIASLGVGNVEQSNGHFVIFTKSKFDAGLDVHLTQDSTLENNLLNNCKKIKINLKIIANKNEKMQIFAGNKFAKIVFESNEILEPAKSNPLQKQDFELQFKKLGDTNFELDKIEVSTNGIFAPKSLLNNLRRTMVEMLTSQTIFENEKYLTATFSESNLNKLITQKIISTPKEIAIVENDNFDFNANTIYVFKPTDYATANATNILQKTKPENFALALPVIKNSKDQIFIDKILNTLPKNIWIYASNIGDLLYAQKGYNVIASPLLNTRNSYAIKCLNTLGITTICASIESDIEFAKSNNLVWFERGNFPLMTFAHCPYKAIFDNTCDNCKCNNNLSYSSNDKVYFVKRTKLSNCYFSLNKQLEREKLKFNITNLCD